MALTFARRPTNEKDQFVLPDMPQGVTPELATIIADYRAGFFSQREEDVQRWDDAATAALTFQPRSMADLAAKLILAIHHRDPECDDDRLAIEASPHPADRLAVEMELACLDHLLALSAGTRSMLGEDR